MRTFNYDDYWAFVYKRASESSPAVRNMKSEEQYALRDSSTDYSKMSYAEISAEQQKLYQQEKALNEKKREAENNPELLQAAEDYHNLFSELKELLSKKKAGTATQSELERIDEIKSIRDDYINRLVDIQERIGLNAISEEEKEIRDTKEELRKASDAAWAREGAEKENKAIEKAGISAPEYFRRKALKAFKTTTNFNEAGYLLPNGKMLNFSGGERNHRYRDHREIGEIYEATSGTAALNRFLNDGNIRIMAESPGIDLAAGVEPTPEQYAAIRKFINSNGAKDGQFFVDFSGTDGSRAGKYSYQDRVNADRIIGDIKYFYQNGTTRQQSVVSQFHSQYSLRTLSDGTEYVKLDGNLFLKNDGTEMTPREAYKSLVGIPLTLSDGDVITLVDWLDGKKNMYNELFKRWPTYENGIDIRVLNDKINRNIIETLVESAATNKNVPDVDSRHSVNGITHFDTRTVNIADDTGAYTLSMSIAKLTDGSKVGYAKKRIYKNIDLWEKIEKESSRSESPSMKPSRNEYMQFEAESQAQKQLRKKAIDDELEISDWRTLTTGYENVPDALMGFANDSTKNKTYDESKYPYSLDVWVSVDGGYTYSADSIKGMNRKHAIERARRNWGTADDGIVIRERTADSTQNQLRTPTYTDREVLEMAADIVDTRTLTPGERSALDIFTSRLDSLKDLQEQRDEQRSILAEQKSADKPDEAEIRETTNRLIVLGKKIKAAENLVLNVENKQVLKKVLHTARGVVEKDAKERWLDELQAYKNKRNYTIHRISKFSVHCHRPCDSVIIQLERKNSMLGINKKMA